ncbi:hypothetical protein ABBQ38_001809 [Trebouxia sp. C0009 RCD-2024]
MLELPAGTVAWQRASLSPLCPGLALLLYGRSLTRFRSQHSKWRMSTMFCLIAPHLVTFVVLLFSCACYA